MIKPLFKDRIEAGMRLARDLSSYADRKDVVVLGLPRGGVPVALEVARELHAPLDIVVVRKLGVPGQEELAMGAIASGGARILNKEIVGGLQIDKTTIDKVTAREQKELERRENAYRGGRPAPDLRGRTVIIVDDGLATGASMRAAVAAVRAQEPARIVVAVPTASPETCDDFKAELDQIVCAETPQPFYAVGVWYEDFSQTTDEDVRNCLKEAVDSLPPP